MFRSGFKIFQIWLHSSFFPKYTKLHVLVIIITIWSAVLYILSHCIISAGVLGSGGSDEGNMEKWGQMAKWGSGPSVPPAFRALTSQLVQWSAVIKPTRI